MDAAQRRRSASRRRDTSSAEALLSSLNPDTDLAHLVKRVCAFDMPWVVVSDAALSGWQRRDPDGWAGVAGWLAARGVAVVRV